MDQILDRVYLALGIVHFRDDLVKTVTLIFLLMLVLITFFIFLTLIIIVINKFKKRYRAKYLRFYTLWLIEYLTDQTLIKPFAPIYQKNLLRDAILDLLFVTKGFEFSLLKELYISEGLWEADLQKIKSPYWHQRLDALVRLDQWKNSLPIEVLAPLLDDEKKSIRQIAMKNLSHTTDPEEAKSLLDSIMRFNMHHSSLHEIIYRLVVNHKPLVLECLKDERQLLVWPIIIQAIGEIRSISSVPTLIDFLKTCDDQKTRENILIAMGQIGDPRSIDSLVSSLGSELKNERLLSLHSLVQVDSSKVEKLKYEILNDPEPLIRSWMGHYEKIGL